MTERINQREEFNKRFHEGLYDKSFFELPDELQKSHFDHYYTNIRIAISNTEKKNMQINDEFETAKNEIENIQNKILPSLHKRLSKLGSRRKDNNEYIQYLKNYRYIMERDEAQRAYENEKRKETGK